MSAVIVVVVALGVSGCTVQQPTTSTTPAPPEAWSEPRPFALPADRLVVPYELIPRMPDSATGITDSITTAFGPLLAAVSVEATDLADITDDDGIEQSGFRIEYRLVECPTPAIMFVTDLDDCGLVPPLTQMYDTPPGRDWMSRERFQELLRAWGQVSDRPFGGLTSYATAEAGGWQAAPRVDDTTMGVDGTERRIGDLWVITEGAASQSEFRKQQYIAYEVPGHVFYFPYGGAPEYLGRFAEIGWQEGLGD